MADSTGTYDNGVWLIKPMKSVENYSSILEKSKKPFMARTRQ